MTDNFREKFAVFGGKLVEGGAEVSRKMSQRMNSVGDKMKELFQVSTQADKFVEDATSDKNGWSPDWGKNLQICDMLNAEGLSGQDVVRAIKKRLTSKSPAVQLLALILLETCVKNCEKMFSEVASEKVLDEMVKLVDDPQTSSQNREKALKMIEAWGEASEELRYLPVFEETYKSLQSRGIRFPGRDEESLAPIFTPPQSVAGRSEGSVILSDLEDTTSDPKEVFDIARNSTELLSTVLSSSPQKEVLQDDLTTALVEQCRQSQSSVHRLIERSAENEAVLLEGLQVNDELQRVLQKFEELSVGQAPAQVQQPPPPSAFVVVEEEEAAAGDATEDSLIRTRPKPSPKASRQQQEDKSMADLDEMIFGKSSGPSKEKKGDDDFITL